MACSWSPKPRKKKPHRCKDWVRLQRSPARQTTEYREGLGVRPDDCLAKCFLCWGGKMLGEGLRDLLSLWNLTFIEGPWTWTSVIFLAKPLSCLDLWPGHRGNSSRRIVRCTQTLTGSLQLANVWVNGHPYIGTSCHKAHQVQVQTIEPQQAVTSPRVRQTVGGNKRGN